MASASTSTARSKFARHEGSHHSFGAGGDEDVVGARSRWALRMSATTTAKKATSEIVPNTCPTDIATMTGIGVGWSTDQTIKESPINDKMHAARSVRE